MDKVWKFLLFIFNWIGATVLFIIFISVGDYLLKSDIVKLRYDWLEYIYFFGIGVISYYPMSYIYDFTKNK